MLYSYLADIGKNKRNGLQGAILTLALIKKAAVTCLSTK